MSTKKCKFSNDFSKLILKTMQQISLRNMKFTNNFRFILINFHDTHFTLLGIFLYYKIIKIAVTQILSCSVIYIVLNNSENSDKFRERAVIRNT